MTGFQVVVLLLAAGLVVNVFWGKISNAVSALYSKKPESTKPNVAEPVQVAPQDCAHGECKDLVDVISCWTQLKDCCEKQNLKTAVQELERIFPLFVVKS
jgi:hypothetical protein